MAEELPDILEALQDADRQIVQALDARAEVVQAYNTLRSESGDETLRLPKKVAVVQAAREMCGAFPSESIEPVFREVLSACTQMITPRVVAYVGSPGGFAHEAALMYFGHAPDYFHLETIEEVLRRVERGEASFGAVPLETSSDGAVTATLQGLVKIDAKLCGEVAIADAGPRTRFGIVGSKFPSRTGNDRTILAVAPGEEPGALYRALHPFADREINLTRVESRPAEGIGDVRHMFFLEMDGHITDRAVLTAVEELRRIARYAKVIGSYPSPDAPR